MDIAMLYLHDLGRDIQSYSRLFENEDEVQTMRYGHSLQWEDGTIAFYLLFTPKYSKIPSCAFLESYSFTSTTGPYSLKLKLCGERLSAAFICEVPKDIVQNNDSVTGEKATNVVLPSVEKWPSRFSVTTCRDTGHITHTFLACDSKSSCWSQGYGPSRSCAAPLSPLPPSFTCRNNEMRVPYTLVCDFRSDCSDASDETFRVFRPCDIGKFHCGNKQVESVNTIALF
ncbi:hypothetical protein BaRGS_00007025 [Batillaria attramentaria]|uniref:Low-density lipoprotein receptor domain class A n=1 Tax=Batillaria attramentaria TaxID=370345 RepID=A0ABD0LRG5_9CAEN